ncbi:Z1 domain-containing protein [Demequina pelophila]|uniref:Z1 domain-containing protein n=1 Tax=Demequina pelophila TaxID=1638984 RepID=UPI00078222EE|nr:Z1 domain-containing protein [Demequina pelophila]
MTDEIDDLYATFRELLEIYTPADALRKIRMFGADESKVEAVVARHESEMLKIREMEIPRTVINGNRDTWYTGPQPSDKCWPAVSAALTRSGWDSAGIDSLDSSSTRIMSLLNHPKEAAFASKGLVVGYVQSGKTTSFTSVIAKAADRGYKLFIVLSGIHNGLRRQTQKRLVSQLVEPNPALWSQLTELDHDFTPLANPASYFGAKNKTHVICVVKKNATVLRKLAEWLEHAGSYLDDCPTLIVDDEADQATVATKSINPLILRIMATLKRSVYLGYTASPFANLLIDPSAEDLYPRDFVVNLPKPAGHFGTEVLFGRHALEGETADDVDDGYDMIRIVPDEDIDLVRPASRAVTDGFVPEITATMERALNYFLLATSARRVRGTGNPHNTMLIHTSVNTSVHNSFREPLQAFLDGAKACIDAPETRSALSRLWAEETSMVDAPEFGESAVPFDDLYEHLPSVIEDCSVIMDNSSSDDRLDYDSGPVVAIAVGGNTLSRGLTLEGLSVSYFVRSASAYDTLLQMGRWFGFRHGYADLPRIWMTEELNRWFRHLATVEYEMRRDIDSYMTEDRTPLDFAVRLRTHPALRVTAAAKMRDAVTAASSYGKKRVQTHYFDLNEDWLQRNVEAADSLVAAALDGGTVPEQAGNGRVLLRDVDYSHIVEFLTQYQFHDEWTEATPDLLRAYIERRVQRAGSLKKWNVALIGNPVKDAASSYTFGDRVTVGRVTRARLKNSTVADIKTLMSRRDAAIDLKKKATGLKEDQIFELRRSELPEHGLLTLYPIDRVSKPEVRNEKSREPLDAPVDVIGAGFVFPAPVGEDSEVKGYVSADLSNVYIEDEDLTAVDGDDE